MNPPPNREVALFSAALELPASQRAAYLDKACADDPALRQRLEALLGVHEKAITFLENPPAGAQGSPADPKVAAATLRLTSVPSEKPGDRIGRYKLLQQIGEGGCGVVYMAEQEEPVRRRVALKVIKLGMDTKSVIARFEAERQALAMMDHANIAKVLDAGTTETGRPYFVMELVRGIKITEYCDEHNRSTKERLELFIQVCHAVQHAHQKGIIHRDLKPSNILVAKPDPDSPGVPKVIDFGIAKATQGRLTDHTLFTAFEQFIGTPAYMSPEQAELTMQDVDTRTDIYSLGVLLYELLIGRTPFDAQELLASGLDAMRRTIREQEPERPSARLSTMAADALTTTAKHRRIEPPKLVHLLRGDLDWIVMKALEKDRARRYETANGLAMDIQRHLNNEPVVARPPSRLYEFRKTVRRHKFGFAAAGAVIAMLMISLAVSTWALFREKEARLIQSRLRLEAEAGEKKAATEAARSEQVARLMKGMLQGVGPSRALGRDTTMLREILDQTASTLNGLKGQPAVEADLRATLGRVYTDLGEYTNAMAMHQRALALRKTLYSGDHSDIAQSLNDLAQSMYQQGNYPAAAALHTNALAMRRKLFGDENLEVAQSLNNLAVTLWGKHDAAEPLNREALAIRRSLLPNEHLDVAESLYNRGTLLWRLGRFPEAESAHREALAIRRKLLGAEHPVVAASLDRLGLLLDTEGRKEEAEAVHREALAMRRKMLGSDHPDVAHSLQNLAFALIPQGKLAGAETVLREALAIRRKRLPADHPETARTLASLTDVLRQQKKLAELETLWREELALCKQRLGGDHPVVATALYELTRTLITEGKFAEAEDLARQELERRKNALGSDDSEVLKALDVVVEVLIAEKNFAEAENLVREEIERRSSLSNKQTSGNIRALARTAWRLQDQGRPIEAETRQLLELARRSLSPEDAVLAAVLERVGASYRVRNKNAEAEPFFRESLAIRKKVLGEKPETYHSLSWLGGVLDSQGKFQEEEAVCREALEIVRKLPGQERWLISSLTGFSGFLQRQRRFSEAEPLIREVVAAQKKAAGHQNPDFARALLLLAENLAAQDKRVDAEASYREAIALFEQLAETDSRRSDYAIDLGHGNWGLADVLRKSGRREQAEAVLRAALQVFERAALEFPTAPYLRQEEAFSRRCLADLLENAAGVDESERQYRAAIAIYVALQAETPENAFYYHEEAYSSWMLAGILERAGRVDSAAAEYRHALALHEKGLAKFPNEKEFKLRRDSIRGNLDSLLVSQGKPSEDPEIHGQRLAKQRQALEQSRKAAESGDVHALNDVAWRLATSPFTELRDGPSAVIFAEKAVTSTNRKDPMLLDTLAAAYAECGQFTNAVLFQKEAIGLLLDDKLRSDFAIRLKLYESNSPCRTHF